MSQNGAEVLDSGAESSSSEYVQRHSSAARNGRQTLEKGHPRRRVMNFSI